MRSRIIEGVILEQFTKDNKRDSLLYANRKGTTIVDKPFNKVLEEVKAINNNVNVTKKELEDKTAESEKALLLQEQIRINYMKIKGGF